MEASHHTFVRNLLPLMKLEPNDRVLELGCGNGWACREMAKLLTTGTIIGLDSSNDCIHEARTKSTAFENILYLWAEAEQVPWQEDFFTHVVCINAVDHFLDSMKAFREAGRILVPGGSLWIVQPEITAPKAEIGAMAQERPGGGALQREQYSDLLLNIGFEKVLSRSLDNSGEQADSRTELVAPALRARMISARKPPLI